MQLLLPRHILRTVNLLAALAIAGIASLVVGHVAAAEKVLIQGLATVTPNQAAEWIAPQLEVIEATGVSMAQADDVAYFLENAMRDRGFKNASVDWKLSGESENAVIILTVSEGDVLAVTRFQISGNSVLEDPAIIELLTDSTRRRLDLKPDATVPFVPADLESGRKKLLEFYTLLGHESALVDLQSEVTQDGATIRVEIAEGLQFVVRSIELPEAPSQRLQEEFQKARSDFSDRKFNAALVSNLRSRIRSAAVNAGYFDASVEILESAREREGEREWIDLVAMVEWGAPVSVSGVTVRGNEKVEDRFFEKHFGDLVGHPYSPGDTNKAVEQLLQTGAFETVRTDPVKQDDGTFHLDVDVEEGYSRSLGVYGGFTNYEGPIAGFEFRDLNLFGMVRSIDSQIEFSQRGGHGEVNYTDPWFLGSEYRFRSGIFARNRSEEGYDKWETGGNYEFSRRFGRQAKTQVSFFGRASYTEVRNAKIDPVFLGETRYLAHFIGISLSHDRRDQPANPRKGFIAQTSASLATSAVGSEVEFFKATGRLGYYLPVGEHTMRFGARAGAITPVGDTQAIPIDLRFYNGGPTTVRSFQERALGAIDPASGYSIGGEFYTVFNAEYEIPVKAFDGLSVVAFGDAGNLLADAGDASLDNMRYAVGLGIRYLTPVGPFRFEYGYNPDQRAGEPEGTFHLGFGFTF